eukprot:TRINITY_DN1345_c0_g3_i1.p1 TRINITY_DN1345_c0_g3~~TRINITY_DN1345_c0_g3_i1.p1  ORF type:complete len:105 (-),score=9.28 TRINITY_DN1345_c0_g3_i1:9-323(-)
MIAIFLTSLVAVITSGSVPAVVYSSLFSSVFTALCGLCQVLSLPEKTTGLQCSIGKGTTSMREHIRKKSVEREHRLKGAMNIGGWHVWCTETNQTRTFSSCQDK